MRMKPMCIGEMTSSFPLMKSGDGRISREIGPTPWAPHPTPQLSLSYPPTRPWEEAKTACMCRSGFEPRR